MNNAQPNEIFDVKSKKKEAEVYYSMGLYDESLGIYMEIVSNGSGVDPEEMREINDRIVTLKSKIDDDDGIENEIMSSQHVEIVKQELSHQGSMEESLHSASALRELGLVDEAISQYENLFSTDCALHEIIPEYITCLLKKLSPANVIEKIDEVIAANSLNDLKRSEVKFLVGVEIERGGHKDLCIELFNSALTLDPENTAAKNKLDTLMTSLASGSRYDYLLNMKLVTKESLQKALDLSKKARRSVEHILIEQFKVKKEDVGKSLSLYYGCPFVSFDPKITVPVELIRNLKKAFLLHDMWVPMSWGKKGVEILLDDPRDLRKTGQIRGLIKTKKIVFSVGVKEDIEKFIHLFFENINKQDETVETVVDELDFVQDISFEEEIDTEDFEEVDEATGQVVKLVDQILVTAYRKEASDIHIEPSIVTKTTGIRMRMDGVCQEYLQLPNSLARGLLSRIKIMAGLDIAERRLPQDGKIKFKRKGIPPFELRLATIPTAGGFEDAVLRILAKAGAMPLDKMGLSERNFTVLKKIISQPYGMVLVVGPTGSGKTTSLHAALGHINKPGIKIWTAEDPVEITQAGLRQVEAKPKIGLDFQRIMRAFLRADPDVIMIGEMRDHETASIGVEASLTGHLVFSTLHTNSAPETITRLLDMGLNALNFSDAFLGVMAQRLVRRLCPECKEAYHPTEEEFNDIVNDYGNQYFEGTGIHYGPDLKLYRTRGCDVCSGTGYKGRLGIHELMEGTKEIKKMIKNQDNTEHLFEQAMKEGMDTLKQDGIKKVFQGLTDINEVRRVCIT
ncbi:General secretion pathway protein E family protein [uncultured Desulfobacterium sp.]|uniref:General secretion pathway protein E family protein n=1 Tax=uncultured Desulfobacterium sp. TaxID=201089 RepID=A0A445MSD1_9BACT|nr:General secretion pathway protein E family protein [uncultured Desulfobacterium sp.]